MNPLRNRHVVFGAPLAVLLLALARPSHAQDGPPPGWKWITDSPARMVDTQELPESALRFTSMAPGWHMTTGPGMLLYDPSYEAKGRFTVEAEMILFPNPSANGFGVFVGGSSLEGAGRSYISFVVRADGSSGVFRTTGDRTEPIADWSTNDAILPHTGAGTVKNVLRVEAQPSQVVFAVNGKQVASLPRSSIPVDGRFGFRIGEGINLHATNLDFLRRLAPAR
jgi:hypothetical protein